MKTKQFLSLLKDNSDKDLIFFYEKGKAVQGGYHITEIKKVSIDSVDCGGRPSEDKQTVVQLWVPEGVKSEPFMKSGKALDIFTKVDKIKPLFQDAEILFEYGDKMVKTSHHSVKDVEIQNGAIHVLMYVAPPVCKPILEMAVVPENCCTTPGCC